MAKVCLKGATFAPTHYLCISVSLPYARRLGPIAQRLERRTHNPSVLGSNPSGPTREARFAASLGRQAFGLCRRKNALCLFLRIDGLRPCRRKTRFAVLLIDALRAFRRFYQEQIPPWSLRTGRDFAFTGLVVFGGGGAIRKTALEAYFLNLDTFSRKYGAVHFINAYLDVSKVRFVG